MSDEDKIGDLRERMASMETTIAALTVTLAKVEANTTALKEVVSNAKAGYKLVLGLFAAAASIGGALVLLYKHVKQIP